jgi:hypothetical protein
MSLVFTRFIGTCVYHAFCLLAHSGKEVYVVGPLGAGAEKALEEICANKRIIHWTPYDEWDTTGQPMIDSRRY